MVCQRTCILASAASVVTTNWLEGRRNPVRFTAGLWGSSILRSTNTDSGVRYSMGTGSCLPSGQESRRGIDHSPPSSAEVCRYTCTPTCASRYSVYLITRKPC